MKRTFFAIILIFSSLSLFSQITGTGTYKSYFKTYPGIDYIFIFNGINSSSSIKYSGSFNNINWYKFSNPTNSISNQSENFNVEDATGYILDVDGVKTTIWVIDYKNYLPKFSSLEPEYNPKNQCEGLNLNLVADIPIMQYKSAQGATFKFDREFELSYKSQAWDKTKWIDTVIIKLIKLPQSELFVNTAPLCNTTFSIEGDQFAKDLLMTTLPKIESSTYQAVAVASHISTTAATRIELQEDARPEKVSTLEGSAPLDIMFESHATNLTEFYKWEIYKNKELLFTRSDKDQRYTFSEFGDYVVKLNVASAYCNKSDSVLVKISDSDIQVPYAFTPNGDGINDEFRVGYRSIVSFKCWVYNRWGKQVYFWTDPQKGWDGKINGKPASEGAFFYIIEAKGADGKEHSRKGNINLLR